MLKCIFGNDFRKEKKLIMYADNEFLIAFSNKLLELAEETTDLSTAEELKNIAEMAIKTCV